MSENKDLHNQGGLVAFLSSMVFVICFFIYLITFNNGVKLDEKVQEETKTGEVAFDLATVKEPWVENPQVVEAGHKIFKQSCAVCHGEKGDLVGGTPTARNLVEGAWKKGGKMTDHYEVISNGIPGTAMASFKSMLKPYERWALVQFIDSITKNKAQQSAEDIATFAKSAE